MGKFWRNLCWRSLWLLCRHLTVEKQGHHEVDVQSRQEKMVAPMGLEAVMMVDTVRFEMGTVIMEGMA